MKAHWNAIMALFFTVNLLGLLTSCAAIHNEQVATSATDYNLVVEKAQNEMLLLNIIRASKRHPMYFTSFNLFRGSITYDFQTGSITIPFGKIGTGLNSSYSIAPNIRYSTSPTFDLAVWDTQEFTRGIMNPVPMKTIDYYWQEGWPKELLLHLFIERIDKVKSDSSEFYDDEFNSQGKNAQELFKKVRTDKSFSGTKACKEDKRAIDCLNEILRIPLFSDSVMKNLPKTDLSADIKKLIKQTVKQRKLQFDDLSDDEQKAIKKLNRLTIEHAYKEESPKMVTPGHVFETFDNYPPNREKFKAFQDELRGIILDCNIVSKETPESIGDTTTASDAKNLKKLIEVHKAGLKLEPAEEGSTKYRLVSMKTDYEFNCKDRVIQAARTSETSLPSKDGYVHKIYLRSPEAILYYIGEIVRVETHAGSQQDSQPKIRVCSPAEFLEIEFKSQGKNAEELLKKVKDVEYPSKNEACKDDKRAIDCLNEILKLPGFYSKTKSMSDLQLTYELEKLIKRTEANRKLQFNSLYGDEQKAIKRLNRLVIKQIFPQETPESDNLVPLFLVHESSENDKATHVVVTYEGTTYAIPRSLEPDSEATCRADRSMNVLWLISQLIGLQKKFEQVPVTGVVNVIGR